MHTYIGTVKSNVSDVVSQEAPSNAKLLEYTILKDENTGPTPSVEPSEKWFTVSNTTEDDKQSFYMRAQSIALNTHSLDQEHEGNEELLKHHERFKSLDLDVVKPVKTLLHHWDDMTNLADLQDEDKSPNDESKSDDVAASDKIPKNTVPFRESVISASSLESFILDEHGNLNRQFSDFDKMKSNDSPSSSCIDIDDVVLATAEPHSIFPIPEG